MTLNCLKKMMTLFDRKQRLTVVLMIAMGVGSAILDTASTYIILPFVYAIMDKNVLKQGIMKKIYRLLGCNSNMDFIVKFAFIIAFIYIITALYKVVEAIITANFRNSTRHSISMNVLNKTVHAPYAKLVHINSAEVQRIISSDISRVNASVVQMMSVITSVLTSVSLIAVLWFLDKGITLFAGLLIIFVVFVINRPISSRVKKIGNTITSTHTGMVKSVQQFFGGYKTIISCGRQKSVMDDFEEQSVKNSKAYLLASTLEAIPLNMSQGIIMASVFIYMAVITIMGKNLNEMLPVLATFALAAMKLLPLVGRVSSALVAVRIDIPAVDSLYDYINEKMETVSGNILSRSIVNNEVEDGIYVEKLSFSFEDSEDYLIEDVSLEIPKCKSVAFIGPTGAGKTTLADIIVGLYSPAKGCVRAGRIDIHKNIDWWRTKIGYISQHIYLMDDTIRQNIVYGYEKVDDKRIWECLKEACIDEYINSLPNGLDTICGENGVRFSGGQQQRIGIARALYSNPEVLVFDEATSALDSETEASIVQSIDNLAGKKTMIIIAHRLSTIENCDMVYKVEKGKVTKIR